MCVCACCLQYLRCFVPAFLLKPQKSWGHQGACCPISGSPMVLWHVESYSSDVQEVVLKLQNWLIIRHILDGSYFRWIHHIFMTTIIFINIFVHFVHHILDGSFSFFLLWVPDLPNFTIFDI